ncbi:MAG: cysteine dioxygenase family protein [Alphaproteobacteria bacterium]|nr:cysteine dioxygenase family protein [Alphaproteobacteria bacterium]
MHLPSLAAERERAIRATMACVRRIEAEQGVSRAALEAIKAELLALAARTPLFPPGDFPPPPAGDRGHRRYVLHQQADGRFALYLNALNPGRGTAPHDHTTWACVAAIEGEGLNRLYAREDDAALPGRARLHLVREVLVRPGQGIALMPDDIHSIHIAGARPARLLHCYGLALEKLHRRVGYDLETGAVLPYNRTFGSQNERH